jgi:hypothetical protein
MSDRKPLAPETVTLILVASRRRCCLCFGLHEDLSLKPGQIAHLNRDPSDNDPDNLAFMCLEHHDWFDSKTSQSKGPTTDEARHYRKKLYDEWRRRDERESDEMAAKPDQSAPPAAALPFQAIDAIDERLKLRWIIREPPEKWVAWLYPYGRHTRLSVERILDGPFHAVADCNERLSDYGWDRSEIRFGRASPILSGQCPGCKALLFKMASASDYPQVWTVRAQTLAELQRLHRGGTPIEGPRIVLQKLQYWDYLLPP